MKFAEKYELSDAITTGRVETFVGLDVARGEKVLVYIFDAPPKKPAQPTVQWVLESFRAVAPEPPGLVVATGKYGGTTYAYLVTQVPDDAVLRRWAQAYESFGTGTRQIAIGPKNISSEPAEGSFARPKEIVEVVRDPLPPVPRTNDPAGGFPEFPSPAQPVAEPAAETTKIAVPRQSPAEDWGGMSFGPLGDTPKREPGEFTRQFLAGALEATEPAAKPVSSKPVPDVSSHVDRGLQREVPVIQEPDQTGRAAPAQIRFGSSNMNPQPSSAPDPGGFTALFRPALEPEKLEAQRQPERYDSPASVVVPHTADEGKSGDFTRFFRGPFDAERPLEPTPSITDSSRAAPRNTPGEFTRVFGSTKDDSFAANYPSSGGLEDTPLRREPGAFTGPFASANPQFPSIEPLPIGEMNASGPTPAVKEPMWIPPTPTPADAPVNPPIAPVQVAPRMNAPRPSVPNGATGLFSVPSREPSTSLPPVPAGPSQYTRIISGGFAGSGALKDQPAAGAPPQTSGGLPDFEMPAPAPPKFTAPPGPKAPAIAAPAAPKAPELGTLPKAKKSSLPIIIILNVLLLIAVLLVVYFAIKH